MRPLIMKTLAPATIALLCLGVRVASASPACVYQDSALRGGPGDSYYLIGTIPAAARVVLVQLRPRWSLISYDGETGYVATAHLSPHSGARSDPPAWVPSLAPSRALTREVDPFFGDASLSGRFDRRRDYGAGIISPAIGEIPGPIERLRRRPSRSRARAAKRRRKRIHNVGNGGDFYGCGDATDVTPAGLRSSQAAVAVWT